MSKRIGYTPEEHKRMIKFYYFCAILVFVLIFAGIVRITSPAIDKAFDDSPKTKIEVVEDTKVEKTDTSRVERVIDSKTQDSKLRTSTKVKVIGWGLCALLLGVGMMFMGMEDIGGGVVGIVIVGWVLIFVLF